MADVPKQGAEALKLLLTHSDVLLLTEEEAAMVTGHSDPRKAADSLLTAPGSLVRWVVLKVGKDGCFVATRDGQVLHHPAMSVAVEDTVGCGDSLAAAVVLGYINGFGSLPAPPALTRAG
jgi:sugar/nucleoside kinase (ribokinase family)